MESLVVYAVLLLLLILLFYLGTRLNRRPQLAGKAGGVKDWLASFGGRGRWLSSLTELLSAGASGQRGQATGATASINKAHPEVQKTLAVLADLYGEFQEAIDGVREETALALEASHQETLQHVRHLEARVRFLEDLLRSRGCSEAEMARSTKTEQEAAENPSSTVHRVMENSNERASTTITPAVIRSGELAGGGSTPKELPLGDIYVQILNALNSGQSRDAVAKELGVGVAEVEIVERVFGKQHQGTLKP